MKKIGRGLILLLVLSILSSCGEKLLQETAISHDEIYEQSVTGAEPEEIKEPVVTEKPKELPKLTPTPMPTPAPAEESIVPEETPAPVTTCTLSVTCEALLENMGKLKEEKRQIVPEDGIIFKSQTVEFFEGESVFDVMLREMKKNKIHFEFVKTPLYDSAYIEGVGNLYEFDCGRHSGWMYRVNGESPTYGCSHYILKNGDKIEFYYTCDMFEK